MEYSTEQLVKSVQDGNRALYARLIQQYQQQLYVYCYQLLLQREEAEDAVQDVFIKAYEKLHQYTSGQSFSAWLYRIAYNHCMNMLKRQSRMKWISILTAPLKDQQHVEDGYAKVKQSELRTLSEQALLRLPPQDRALIVLRVVQEKSYEEIQEVIPISTALLRKKVERAKKKLRTIWLELEGNDHEYEQKLHQGAECKHARL
ncbi:RNA polymerase sigma factor [Paenibacillus sp. GXUN7292]|uniref:RNA polymerase sigma factor n=1 Tax=Paenibacillus sp. GXUN7292 TaxID=3422499 RepID=UPI003D7E3BB0